MSRRSNGEGSVTHRKDGRWQAAIQLGSARRILYGKTRAEVVLALRKLTQSTQATGQLPTAAKVTLAGFLEDWQVQRKLHVRPSTLHNNATVIRLHTSCPSWGASS